MMRQRGVKMAFLLIGEAWISLLGAPHFHGQIIISYLKKMIQGGANEAGPIFN